VTAFNFAAFQAGFGGAKAEFGCTTTTVDSTKRTVPGLFAKKLCVPAAIVQEPIHAQTEVDD
jgi:hypothetical protein